MGTVAKQNAQISNLKKDIIRLKKENAQLKNIIEWLLIMAPMGEIKSSDLPIDIRSSSPISDSLTSRVASLPLKEAREEFEKQYLKAQLTRFNGNISRTAEFIGMERSALHRKLKFLGLSGSYA